ncbi:MAG: helix-turn-helix domain-containing protein [Clostridia bacterium]|nr:helix-turn-helix domain-containing protein [Clostridia bacterium]
MTFSTVLKQLREERQLSQKIIAEFLGITRQAIASYELGKREPDYDILRKLADYFGVSVDYLLGRSICKDVNAVTVGSNIILIKGGLTYKELSEAISRKTGTLIYHDLLESYAKGEKMPFIGTIKILARYAGVRESFFYTYNTEETLEEEKTLYTREMQLLDSDEVMQHLALFDRDLLQWMVNQDNMNFIELAKEMQEKGVKIDTLKSLITDLACDKALSE